MMLFDPSGYRYNEGCVIYCGTSDHYCRCKIVGAVSKMVKGFYRIPDGTPCEDAIKLMPERINW